MGGIKASIKPSIIVIIGVSVFRFANKRVMVMAIIIHTKIIGKSRVGFILIYFFSL
jgi:hypothetical protein